MKEISKYTAAGFLFLLICALLPTAAARAADPKTLYQSDFKKAAVDALPDGFLALDGGFKVKDALTNKVLELPGAPAESFYGVLFGPVTNSGVCVGARIYGVGARRRSPVFGVGLNGANGYCLRVSAAKQAIEIFKGDDFRTNAPFAWKTGVWTLLRLQVRSTADQTWKIEAKAWPQGTAEPKEWMLTLEEKTPPSAGRASVWGTPLSGTPIWFDDLTVTELAP
ncbi:MAG: hypothetical protein ABSF38_17100 [Verrucomicrobiota bacterium]